MIYQSTRGQNKAKTFTEVLMDGLAPDGGLYVPQSFPRIDRQFLSALKNKPYHVVAASVIGLFTGDSIPVDVLADMTKRVYAHSPERFRARDITPLARLSDDLYVLELFHGPTLAFKDIALQLLGQLFDHTLKTRNENITIIGATSGDTGSAAIEGVKHCANARIFILHPHNRTSEVQRRQMTTVQGDNVFNTAIDGSFDDCQNIVKNLFNNADFRQEQNLSAVNSINWARIIAQTVYYVYIASQFDTPVRFSVPTGNFGNVYAAYVAKQMGVPIAELIIGSNRNDILTRFFKTGVMTVTNVEPSYSPSMDIQISSNLERYLFDLFGRDANRLTQFMHGFKQTGTASVDDETMTGARHIFRTYRCGDDLTLQTIADIYKKYGYLCDPHTAVGISAALQHGDEYKNDGIPTIALACAHPAKFPDAVEKSVGFRPQLPEYLADLFERQEKYTVLPADTDMVRDFIKKS